MATGTDFNLANDTRSGQSRTIMVVRYDDDYTATVRSMIQHEDALRDQRLGWLFALNGFLFTALGFGWKDDKSTPLVYVISPLGVAVALTSAVTLACTGVAIDRLASVWKTEMSAESTGPVMGLRSEYLRLRNKELERLHSGFKEAPWLARLAGNHKILYSWNAAPRLLALAWLVVLAIRICQY